MYFNVSQLLKQPSGARRTYEVDETSLAIDGGRLNRIAGKVNLIRTDESIWASAALDASLLCTCSRCLTEYEQPIHITVEDEFFSVADQATESRLDPLGAAGEYFSIDRNHILDLSEAVRQYSSLDIPMKPVCRDDCSGMCPSCGANLNEAACACGASSIDSRWGPLLQLENAKDG